MKPSLPVPPRRTLHTGTVAACGLWFPADLPARVRLERLMAAWRPGCRVFETRAAELLVEFEAARLVDCRASPAWVLVREGEVAQSAPLRANERPPSAAPGSFVIVEGGSARCVHRHELVEIDPGELLDLSALAFERVETLGAAPELAEPEPAPTTHQLFDGRVGRSAADRARQRELLDALGAADREGATAPGTLARGSPRRRPALAAALFNAGRGALTRAVKWLRAAPSAKAAGAGDGSGNPSDALARYVPSKAAAPSFVARLAERLQRWFADVLLNSRLALLLERKQAQYLQRLLELLDSQDDLGALKHAIPLSNAPGESGPRALSAPQPRPGFSIDLGPKRAAPALVLAHDLFAHLRRAYEAVFERLDRAGRFDEAAFVLAELLGDAARAVAYLERHKRFVLAAELAEARELAPGLVVRQWFLANDRKRALRLAAKLGAFSEAIQRLERSGHHDEASSLRLLHADRLAGAGKLALAAREARPVPGANALVLGWLEAARSLGDFSAITLELELAPAHFDAVYRSLVPLLESPAPDDSVRRRALAQELLDDHHLIDPQRAAILPLARELSRALLADTAENGDERGQTLARVLANAVGGAFRADFPRLVAFERRTLAAPVEHRFAASDVGLQPVLDVFKVAQRLLLALGEAGVRLCDTNGRVLAHFDVPAHRLVVAPGSPHVLALAQRGGALRVSRIHLATRRSQPWTEIVARAWAPSFDGESWLIVRDTPEAPELLALDAASDGFDVLQRAPLPPLAVLQIQVDERDCCVLAHDAQGAPELLRYQLDKLTLRQRAGIALPPEPSHELIAPRLAVGAKGQVVIWDTWVDAEGAIQQRLRQGARTIPLPAGDLAGVADLWVQDSEFAVALQQNDRVRVLAGSLELARTTLDLSLEGARDANVRLAPPLISIGDSDGRVLAYDLGSGQLVHDVRVR